MDKQIIKKSLENYARKYVLLFNQYDREVGTGMYDIDKLDKDYERRYEKLFDKFLEEISVPSLRLKKENTVKVYDYNDKFAVEVVEEKEYRSAWLYHKRNNGYDFPKAYLCGAKIEDTERITDEYDMFLEEVVNTILKKDSAGWDNIDYYNELYVGEEE